MNILIEVAISLIVVFLLLSLATTTVNEAIASLFKTRARHLSQALEHLLTDQKVRDAFYRHPLISTFRMPNEAAEGTKLVGSAHKLRRHPSYIPSKCFAKALHRAILDAQEKDATAPAQKSVSGFRETATKIEDESLRTSVLALIDSASGNLEETKQAFSIWFDTAMDGLSGQFKRRQQLVSFFIGFGLAAFLNINVFTLANELIENDARRLAFVEFGEAQLEREDLVAFFEIEADDPNGVTLPESNGDTMATAPINPFQSMTEFGFSHENFQFTTLLAAASDPLNLLSWVIAAMASILGAAFWFDVLKHFVNIRGSGVRPPKDLI